MVDGVPYHSFNQVQCAWNIFSMLHNTRGIIHMTVLKAYDDLVRLELIWTADVQKKKKNVVSFLRPKNVERNKFDIIVLLE